LGAWADVGTPERYLRACQDLLTGWCDLSALGEFAPLSKQESIILQTLEPQKRTYIHSSAEVSAKAVLEGALVGAGAKIGQAVLRQAVVLPGTFIADGECWEETLAAGTLRIDATLSRLV
jgi:NDP-sugar pyrophosphorylase family protein